MISHLIHQYLGYLWSLVRRNFFFLISFERIMVRTEHPQCWLLWKHPSKKNTNIYVNALWQVILFVSLTGLRNILSINEAHLWVHLWGHFHRFNREETIHPEYQQCHLMRQGLGPNEKRWRRKGESQLMPAFPVFHFSSSFSSPPPPSSFFPWLLVDVTECPPSPVLPTLPLSSPPYGLPSKKKCWGKEKAQFVLSYSY